VRLFGRETPGGWTDRGPHVPAVATSSGSAALTALTGPAPTATPSHVDVAATRLRRAG